MLLLTTVLHLKTVEISLKLNCRCRPLQCSRLSFAPTSRRALLTTGGRTRTPPRLSFLVGYCHRPLELLPPGHRQRALGRRRLLVSGIVEGGLAPALRGRLAVDL